jgi:hypothetical protein
MLKIFALIALSFTLTGCFAHAQVRSGYESPQGAYAQTRGPTCPRNTTRNRRGECQGTTVTDPTQLEHFGSRIPDRTIRAGCVPGAKKWVWVDGTGARGQPKGWWVEMTARCNRKGEAKVGPVTVNEDEEDED